MRVLLINKFLYPKGGDAISTLTTGKLLESKGHEVIFWGMAHPDNPKYPYEKYFVPNIDYLGRQDIFKQIKLSMNILYSFEAKRCVLELLKEIKPDIIHLNNFAHQISPSVLDVFSKYNIPTVMTMRDLKMVCPTYLMLLNDKGCEKCKSGKYYNCFLNKCTKGSLAKSLVNSIEMYLHHKILNIYDKIDIYISPSLFLKNKVKEMGFDKEVRHLPNFIDISTFEPEFGFKEKSVVYCGRVSQEKGIITLIDAVKNIDGLTLKIAGDGPLKEEADKKILSEGIKNVVFLGYQNKEDLARTIKSSMFTIITSQCYENNPRSVIESFALGKPAIGARIGGIPELVVDGETGFTFEAGNYVDLRNKIESLLKNPSKIIEMGKAGRKMVEEFNNSEVHYQGLMAIYQDAAAKHKK